MSNLRNSVRLSGFLGSKPEVKKYGDHKQLARVSLAVNERFKNRQGEWFTDTQWHNLVFWGKQAFFAEKNLDKGNEITIEGKLINRTYQDKVGSTHFITEIVVLEVQVFSKKKETISQAG